MKNDITEIVFILDKSGSMSGMEGDTIGGFNSMLDKQKKNEGEAFVTTVLFSNESRILHDRLPIDKVEHITDSDYYVGGNTALLDAIGDTVEHIKTIHKYANKEDVPEHTIFIITTDGMENSSHKYSSKQVKSLIKEQEKNGWQFIFIAANIDAVETADYIGIDRESAVGYCQSAAGTRSTFECMDEAISLVRANKSLSKNQGWKKKIKR